MGTIELGELPKRGVGFRRPVTRPRKWGVVLWVIALFVAFVAGRLTATPPPPSQEVVMLVGVYSYIKDIRGQIPEHGRLAELIGASASTVEARRLSDYSACFRLVILYNTLVAALSAENQTTVGQAGLPLRIAVDYCPTPAQSVATVRQPE